MKRVIQGTISSPFGMRYDPINNLRKQHQGVDIAAPVGTPIYAPAAGTIAVTYDHTQGGRTMIIRSLCGMVRYGLCHLSAYEKMEGDAIKAGELIARSGNTGRSTGPHLHFSVKRGGQWRGANYTGGEYVNSAPYLNIP